MTMASLPRASAKRQRRKQLALMGSRGAASRPWEALRAIGRRFAPIGKPLRGMESASRSRRRWSRTRGRQTTCARANSCKRAPSSTRWGATLPDLLLPDQHEFGRWTCIGSLGRHRMDRQRTGIRDCASTGTRYCTNGFRTLRSPRLTGGKLFSSYPRLVLEPLLQFGQQYPRAAADLERPRERRVRVDNGVDVLARALHSRCALGNGNGNGLAHMLSPKKTCIWTQESVEGTRLCKPPVGPLPRRSPTHRYQPRYRHREGYHANRYPFRSIARHVSDSENIVGDAQSGPPIAFRAVPKTVPNRRRRKRNGLGFSS